MSDLTSVVESLVVIKDVYYNYGRLVDVFGPIGAARESAREYSPKL